VEQCHTSSDFSLPDQRTALTLKGKSSKVFVAEALTDGRSLYELRLRRYRIARVKRAVPFRQQQVSSFNAVGLPVEQPARARQPATRLCDFSIDQQREPQPERGTGSPLGISATEESVVGARQKVSAFSFSSRQQGGLRVNNEIARR